ncbi:hypothetical protein CO026_01450 [Candidatus Kaiserbacteria bacterium CG_4_9_14_0_2_um_filter_41_32]|uniref:Uncharacterized protein n=1 Tax=Candidatus Kaiserbacteria bacterium CG_4_9_14_0_2_um_filter_41_32 TaxID=1974601 RepID=A0A2M8FF63_9BACT|nr:MAG: hypothetical protein CO026_01450 [Candidatus Kaiserbacteria bacterium CG_4_9_14_0_2_um_filter_41_32]
MNEVLHANIFFIIASIATVAFAIMVCIAMYYVIKILISIRAILERVEEGSDMIAEDITTVRNFVTKGAFISHLMGLFIKTPKKSRTKRANKKTTVISDSK